MEVELRFTKRYHYATPPLVVKITGAPDIVDKIIEAVREALRPLDSGYEEC